MAVERIRVTNVQPPAWAESLLMAVVPCDRRESVSGDLLEGFRENAASLVELRSARWWYVREVASFVWRSVAVWTALVVGLFVTRTVLDAFVPTRDFQVRAAATTFAAVTLWFSIGFLPAWRTGLVRSSVVIGAVTGTLAPAMTVVLTLTMMVGLVATDSQRALMAIDRAGGISEILLLPVLSFLPATALAIVGGVAARLVQGITSVTGRAV